MTTSKKLTRLATANWAANETKRKLESTKKSFLESLVTSAEKDPSRAFEIHSGYILRVYLRNALLIEIEGPRMVGLDLLNGAELLCSNKNGVQQWGHGKSLLVVDGVLVIQEQS